jgi:DAK2 domain fusion protein YloV
MAMSAPAMTASGPRATGDQLRAALLTASDWLDSQAERINALNVFPVPDGDTGTNMSLTLRAAADALKRLPGGATAGEVAQATYRAAMLGARGNSGVILSQLLSGFASALKDAQEMGPGELAAALRQASEVAYAAVSRPVEGTILTVAREAASAAEEAAAQPDSDVIAVLERTLAAASLAVAATPSQLEVLARAGVVDSGGEGYRVILEGAWLGLTGRAPEETASARAPHTRALLEGLDHAEQGFGFCTELLLKEADLPTSSVKSAMEELGDSVIVVGDRDLLRVHVHTPRPGRALEFAVDHGTVCKVKVENMQIQHEEFSAAASAPQRGVPEAEQVSSIGVIAVAAGEGFKKVFRSLGAVVVEGGQTMNPSVQDILSAVQSCGYREVVVLPNNPNIVLTARQVQELTPHTIEVVPTESVPQGIGALLAFNFEADLGTNVDAMRRAARSVRTVEVTRAVRDAEVDGVSVRSGDWLGIFDGKVVAASDSGEAAGLQAIEHASLDSLEVVTIYYGADSSEPAARHLAEQVRAARPGLEVEVVSGDQPHYPYVVSLE